MSKKFWFFIAMILGVALLIGSSAFAADCIPKGLEPPKKGECASILPDSWCESNGIWEILSLVLNIITAGVGVLATIGIVVAGIQWLTARDNETQLVKAKSRIFNVVLGVLTFGLMWLFMTWLMPGELIAENLANMTTPAEVEREICPEVEVPSNTTGEAAESSRPIGNPEATSENIACDPRTIDLGIHDGWDNGKRTYYRLCSIPNLPSTSTAGYAAVLRKAGRMDLSGKAVLNSRVAGAMYSMVAAAKADGITLSAGSTFRSFEWQRDNCSLSAAQKNTLNAQRETGSVSRICNKDRSLMAAPGYSNHQSGTAIDFKRCSRGVATRGPCPDKMYGWLRTNATRFGFSQYVAEYWHYDTR